MSKNITLSRGNTNLENGGKDIERVFIYGYVHIFYVLIF